MALVIENQTKNRTRLLEVRLVEDQYELEMALALRYSIFNLEMGEGLPQSRETQKDTDEYDYYCDHLIVLDKANENKIVGTYRILRGEIAAENIGFYSENEFNLSNLYKIKNEIAEVGRSCVHADYRDGSVISMLWIGLGEYMKKHNLRYLMGCGSVHSTNAEVASIVYSYLKNQNVLIPEDFNITPLPSYKLNGFQKNYLLEDPKQVTKQIPPLIKGYIRLGAKMSGEPALDHIFKTTDFFILFDVNQIDARYGKHYKV